MTTLPARPLGLWELEWTFGDRVRKARRAIGLTAADLGEALGMTAQGVSNLEGRPNTPRNARAIAAQIELRFGVPSWWILGYDAPRNEETPGLERPGVMSYTTRDSNPEPIDLETGKADNVVPLRRQPVDDVDDQDQPGELIAFPAAANR